MNNPGHLVPAIGYDIVYLLTNYAYMLIFGYIIRKSMDEHMVKMRNHRMEMREKIESGEIKPRENREHSWIRFVVTVLVIASAVVLSITVPQTSTIFLLGLPVVSSITNLVFDQFQNKKDKIKEKQS